MKRKWINNSASVLVFILAILSFSFLRSKVDQTSFVMAFDKILTNIVSSIWNLIAIPAIFISILIVLVLWKYQSEILAIIPYIKEIKAGSLSATFENQASKPIESNQDSIQENKNTSSDDDGVLSFDDKKSLQSLSRIMGKGSVKFLLDLDGKILNPKKSVEKFRKYLTKFEKNSINKMDENHQFAYYFGCYEVYMNYIGLKFVTMKVSEDNKTAYFSLKPDSTEILNARIKDLEKITNQKK